MSTTPPNPQPCPSRTGQRSARALYLELVALGASFKVYRDPAAPVGLSGEVHLPPGHYELLQERIQANADELLSEVLLLGFSGEGHDGNDAALIEEARA